MYANGSGFSRELLTSFRPLPVCQPALSPLHGSISTQPVVIILSLAAIQCYTRESLRLLGENHINNIFLLTTEIDFSL